MSLLLISDPAWKERATRLLRRLPPLAGDPIHIQTTRGLSDRRGPVHAGAFLRERRIVFDCTRAEFPRIFVHELFHFVWLRAGNPFRRSYEDVLAFEHGEGAFGELGWSAEWRKELLRPPDMRNRTRRWREYCCESFCDTAAWWYSGVRRHEEYTLPESFRIVRQKWLRGTVEAGQLSI